VLKIFCEICKKKINPYMLKQFDIINGKELLEIECLSCRKYNYVDIETYMLIRKDWEMPVIKCENLKKPQSLNIIVVSNERCGISWICKIISEVHEKMFNTTPEWDYEISRLIARKKHLPLPQGWNTVYDLNPEVLLERGYDRVLVVQRDLDTLLKAQMLYNHDELSNEYVGINEDTLLRKVKENWELVYGKEIIHPKCLKVRLEDLNNYTVASFNEILDFLNFPTYGRPVIIPTSPPDRNWEAYSSILPKNHSICKRLEEIDVCYKKNKNGCEK